MCQLVRINKITINGAGERLTDQADLSVRLTGKDRKQVK